MYRTNDKQQAIREVKKYLYVISTKVYPQIGRTTIDGQYDPATRDAVRAFQRIKGLTENGEVDIETFNALYDTYRKAKDNFYARSCDGVGLHFPAYLIEQIELELGQDQHGVCDAQLLHIVLGSPDDVPGVLLQGTVLRVIDDHGVAGHGQGGTVIATRSNFFG